MPSNTEHIDVALAAFERSSTMTVAQAAAKELQHELLLSSIGVAAREGRPKTASKDTVISQRAVAEAAGVAIPTVKRHTQIEQRAPALLPMVERGDIGLLTAVTVINAAPAEILERATPQEIKALAAAVGDRLEVRIKRMLGAANEVREQFHVLRNLEHPEAISACAELRLVLGTHLHREVTK
jgi:hypothetical protein